MSAVGIVINGLQAKPPYITFEKRAVERRKTAEEGGEVFYVDVDFAMVTPHGSKDTVEKVVEDWLKQLKFEVQQQRFPQEWLNSYKASYEAWRNDQEPPLDGTDVRNWAAASPAEIKALIAARILTLEILATANEETIGRLGMGGRALKDKAIDYLTAKEGTAPLVQQLSALRSTVNALEARNIALSARVEAAERQTNRIPFIPSVPDASMAPPSLLDRHERAADNTDQVLDQALREELDVATEE